jgi:hypothetical protein
VTPEGRKAYISTAGKVWVAQLLVPIQKGFSILSFGAALPLVLQ